MERLAQLQAMLREIENGARLESVDSILVRQALQQPPPPYYTKHTSQHHHKHHALQLGHSAGLNSKSISSNTAIDNIAPAFENVAGKDAYRALLELHKKKKKKAAAEKQQGDCRKKDDDTPADQNQQEAPRPTKSTRSLAKGDTVRLGFTIQPPIHLSCSSELTAQKPGISEALAVPMQSSDALSSAGPTDKEMQISIKARGKELVRSQQQAVIAKKELHALLEESQKLLPNQFLFERNLKDFCQERSLQVIQNVLLKFQNRFYKLYFHEWRAAILELRRIAHNKAVETIIRVFRGHRARQSERLMRQQLAEFKAQAQKLLDFRIKYRKHQAQKIQMVWRRFLHYRAIRSRQQRKASALYLQKLFRDRKLQRNQLVHTLLHVKKVKAAIVFQKLYRGHRTRSQLHQQRRQQKREALVAAILARNVSKEALLQWKMDRQGAAFLICTRALYPFAVKRRILQLIYLARRQRAAQIIARRVCIWFGVSARRQQAQAKQLAKWLQVLKIEQLRTRVAAIRIQKHLRRWVQQRKFQMVTTRRKKLARRQRIADKEATKTRNKQKLKQLQHGGNLDRTASFLPILSSSSSTKPTVKKPREPKFASALKAIGKYSQQHRSQLESKTVETQAANKIARCYVRHKRHTMFLLAHWRAQAVQVELRVLKRRKAVIIIQKRVRSVQARKIYRQLKAEKLLVSYILKWKWKRIVKFVQAARKIYRWLQHKRTQRFAQLWRLERRKQHTMATKIQQMVRSKLWIKRKLGFLLAKARKWGETQLFCAQSLRICAQHLKDELIFASLSQPFEENLKAFLFPSTGSHKNQTHHNHHQRRPQPDSNAPVFPMMPMVFLVVSGAKDPLKWKDMGEGALLQTKMDRSRVVALFKAVNKHFQDNYNTKNTTKSSSSSPSSFSLKAKSKVTNTAFFSMTDVDLALAKASGVSKRALTFDEFTKVLRLLSEMKLTRVSIWWSKFDGSDAQLFSLLWEFLFALPEFQSLVHQLDDFVTQVLNKRCARIQQLFRRGNNLKHGMLMRLEMRKQLQAQAKARACTTLQARVRMFLAKKQLRLRIQQTYEKYIDPEWGLPYWTNPKSGYSTWEKPRVLRAEDVATELVPYPPASLTLKIQCEGDQACAKCAEWFCYECEEFFCGACLPTFHKDKGSRSESSRNLEVDTKSTESTTISETQSRPNKKTSHEMEKIALCGLCQFQVASRKCLSCLPKTADRSLKKKKSTVSSSEGEKSVLGLKSDATSSNHESEALFCDVCFAFTHRRGALQVHKSIELLEMCQSCSIDDDEDSEELYKDQPSQQHQRQHFKKKDPARAVQHECEHYETMSKTATIKMRVCGKCVSTNHSVELCGDRVKKTPLQTVMMLERARRIAEELEAQDRADVEKMKARALQAKRERYAARIQKFWRAKVPILRAKHIVARLKAEKQEHWRRLREDAKLEKQLVYLVRNFFGLAKPLQTDTAVKKKLREMNALQRRQLTIRARMFGLLAHEYMRVGIPLPGVGRILKGSPKEIVTTEDLCGWVKNRQTIRLKRINVTHPRTAKEKAKALENLSSWSHLSKWDHSDAAAAGKTESGFEELLVDVDAKEKLAERTIPLAQPVEFSDGGAIGAGATGTEKQQEEGGAVEEERVFVLYLVEYSMDPKRVVWINHSLAERFWAWKRQKNLDRKERRQQAREEKERKARTDADASDTSAAAAGSTVSSVKAKPLPAEQAPAKYGNSVTEQSAEPPYADYYSYLSSNRSLAARTGGAEASEAAAYGYDNASSYNNYEYGYGYGYGYNDYSDYNYDYASRGVAATEMSRYPATNAAPLVDSSGYFYAPDGNANAWQGYDYDYDPNAYNVSELYFNSYSHANGAADYEAVDAEGVAQSAVSSNSQSSEASYGDVNGNYYQEGAAWGDSADYYSNHQQQQQPIAVDNYSADRSCGYSAGFTDGYIDHHSQSSYPESQIPIDGGGEPGYGYGYSTELGAYEQTIATAEYEANANAQTAWEEVFDPQTSQVYYVNRITQETAWELPSNSF